MTAEELNMDQEIMWQMFTPNLNMTGKCAQTSCIPKLVRIKDAPYLSDLALCNFSVFLKLKSYIEKKIHVQLNEGIHKQTVELLTGPSQKHITGCVNHSRKCCVGETYRHNNVINN
jgi:hypothetical protein